MDAKDLVELNHFLETDSLLRVFETPFIILSLLIARSITTGGTPNPFYLEGLMKLWRVRSHAYNLMLREGGRQCPQHCG